MNHRDQYPKEQTILLNCFALGSWATGMNVSTALADVGIIKSIGCERQKLENTIQQFGPNYRYLIFGYPPFIKSFIDLSALDLSQYRLNLIVGGEPVSESLRSYLLEYFETVISSYGASDLEINLGRETDLTIALRRLCQKDPSLSQQIFNRSIPPSIFQYNPIEHCLEISPTGELIYTVTRSNGAAPKVRYNLPDRLSTELLRDFFWQQLSQSNQDFREVTKMFDRQSIEIEIQSYCTGVFSQRDPRTKHQYVAGK